MVTGAGVSPWACQTLDICSFSSSVCCLQPYICSKDQSYNSAFGHKRNPANENGIFSQAMTIIIAGKKK